MIVMMRCALFVSLVLALIQPTVAQTATTISDGVISSNTWLGATTPTPVADRPSFEIDIIFPHANTTYNYTEYLPIIFAFQNLTTAAALGDFQFIWGIMPYGDEEDWRPSGLYEDDEMFWIDAVDVLDSVNSDRSPYYLVNSTNTTNWEVPLVRGRPSLFSLQWSFRWTAFSNNSTCRDIEEIGDIHGHIFFTLYQDYTSSDPRSLNGSYPSPQELGNVTGNCAQFGSIREMNTDEPDLCLKAREVSNRNPCAVKPDAAMMSSMSSVAALRAKPTPTETWSEAPVSTNAASAMSMPIQPVLLLAGIVGLSHLSGKWEISV